MRSWLVLLTLLALGPPGDRSGLPPLFIQETEVLALDVRLVATGPRGSIALAEESLSLSVGDRASLELAADLGRAGGASHPVKVELGLSGRIVDDTSLELQAEVAVHPAAGDPVRRVRRGTVIEGGSLLVDAYAPPGGPPRRLLVVVEARRGVAHLVERKALDLRPIDLVLDVSHVDGQAVRLLEKVRMTTLSARPVDYAFRLHLPAETLGREAGEGVAEVAVAVRVLPRRLEDGRVDLLLTLSDERGWPWTSGEPLERFERRTVESGEGLSMQLSTLGRALTYRFHVEAFY